MKIAVQFYAQLRDITRAHSLDFELGDNSRICDLLEDIYARFPALRAHDKTILIGSGVEFVDRNYKLKSGDEIAIMPPVQGG